MTLTTHDAGRTGQVGWTFTRLPVALALSLVFLDACGGGSGNVVVPPAAPTMLDGYEASAAQLQGKLDLATGVATLSWYDSFPNASRYQIERQESDGTWSVLDAVWATQGSGKPLYWSAPLNIATTFRVEAVQPAYNVPLETIAENTLLIAPPAQMPAIALDAPQPVEDSVNVSIVDAGSFEAATYSVDSVEIDYSQGQTPAAIATSSLTTGTHLLTAALLTSVDSTLLLNTSLQVHTSQAAIRVNVVESPTVIDAYFVATSDSGVVSVAALIDEQPQGSLTTPNSCIPTPCAPGQPFNAYHFAFATDALGVEDHSLRGIATDAAGNTASTTAELFLPAPTTATLDSPVSGASVMGTMPISGTVASGATGALEVLVTLSGTPVYDVSMANPGTTVPFAANVALAGIAAGSHSLDVYARVGNTSYLLVASAFITVTTP